MKLAISSKEGLFGEALTCLVNIEGQYDVVATESNLRTLVASSKDNGAQILVVDSFGLSKDELQFLLGARAFGEFGVVLIVPNAEKESYLDTPVDRLVGREDSSRELFGALESLSSFVLPSVVRERRRTYGVGNELTRREYEVAQYIAKGLSNRRISQSTGLREQSIKNLVSVIMRKLNCENRVQVALKLTRNPEMAVASAE